MKKWLIRIVLAVVVLLVIVVVTLGLFLDQAVKKGVETVGPELTKVSIKLDGVSMHLLTGSGSIKGLEVGNPEGYKGSPAIKLGRASVSVSPGSLLSDKIVIKSIRIEAPEINIEGSPTKNNLTKILENVEAATGGASTNNAAAARSGPGKKLEVDEFILTNAKVNYTVPGVGLTVPIALPEIKLTDLGKGPEGITGAELTKVALSKLTADLVPLLGAEVGKTVKGVTDLFKKKKRGD